MSTARGATFALRHGAGVRLVDPLEQLKRDMAKHNHEFIHKKRPSKKDRRNVK